MSFKHLGMSERAQIEGMLACNITTKRAAEILGYSESALSKEIKRNSRPDGFYSWKYAQKQYGKRRKASKEKRKLKNQKIIDYIEEKLEIYWSPENISDNIHEIGESISVESCYKYIYGNPAKKLWKYLRRGRKKRKKRRASKSKRGLLPNRVSIHKRPKIVEKRSRIGDWELDTVIGAQHQGVVATFVERKSRFTLIGKMMNKSSAEMARVALLQFSKIKPENVLSMTADNGKEFACHEFLARELSTEFYFADPYSSWQRGTNENTNGLLRQFIPKGQALTHVTQEQLDHYAYLLNTRPRKCLGNRTPLEVFDSS